MKLFKFTTVRQKIALLIVIGVLSILAIVVINKFIHISQKKRINLGRNSYEIAIKVMDILRMEEQFIAYHKNELLPQLYENRKKLLDSIEHAQSLANDPTAIKMFEDIISVEKEDRKIFDQIVNQIRYIDDNLELFVKTMNHMNKLSNQIISIINQKEAYYIMQGEHISINEVSLKEELKNLQLNIKTKMNDIHNLFLFSDLQTYEKNKADLEAVLKKDEKNIQSLIGALSDPEFNQNWSQILQLIKQTRELEIKIVDAWKIKMELAIQLEEKSSNIQKLAVDQAALSRKYIEDQLNISDQITAIISIFGVFGFLVLGIIISRNTRKALLEVVHGLNDGSSQISIASAELTNASQALTEVAGNQAASVQETSSELDEMVTLCDDTCKQTFEADQLMNQNIEKSAQSLKNLVSLSENMSKIEADSSRVGQIIKTIDEIAFQTNLLALNAAVEAARAGEAGSGFAVVADEVRNLAIRSASAAKDTQELLQATLERVHHATNALKFVSNDFESIIESATVMGEKTKSINQASERQKNGINHLKQAMIEIDNGSQQIASNSEETAATAEQLSAQAEQLKQYVLVLIRLI